MSKSKLTLIVDGNWLLMSRISVINNKYLDKDELSKNLKLLLIRSIKLVLKQFPSIDNIMFVSDGGSWRNKLEIPKFMNHEELGKEVEYKGTREKSEDIDWDLLFSIYEEFIALLKQANINTYREKDIEGDDWCWFLSRYLNSEGTNCIIWTKDKDLTQLVSIDQNKCFTVWWNKENGCYIPIYDEENLDFLFNFNYNNNELIFREVINNSGNVTQINPNEVVIDKILKGDMSDNVLPTIIRNAKNNTGRKFKISNKDINYSLDYFNDQDVYNYLQSIVNLKNYKDRLENSLDEIYEHFLYNRQLVVLDKKCYPQYILDIFENFKEYNTVSNIYTIESSLLADQNNVKSILDII